MKRVFALRIVGVWLPMLLGCFALGPVPAGAEVLRVEIVERTPLLGGQAFGEAGAYELLRGRVQFGFDPTRDANARIADLALAPRGPKGLVHATADLFVLQAIDPERRRGTALVEAPNRGRRLALAGLNRAGLNFGADARMDPQRAADFGDGFAMEQGLTIVWVGWQADVPPFPGAMRIEVPTARHPDGSAVRGLARSDWVIDEPATTLSLGALGHVPIPAAQRSDPRNRLTVRDGRDGERRLVPRKAWRFDDSLTSIELRRGGFEPGRIYELVYAAEDPPILGLGFAAFRDIAAYALHDPGCAFTFDRAIALGSSQSGRFLRHFLHDGFNRDEAGRRVYEGMLIHIGGAGRGGFNHRFGHPGRVGNPFRNFAYPGDDPPFASRPSLDPHAPGAPPDGIFDRARASGTLPKIFQTNTGYEYWGRVASLVHMTRDGRADLAPLAEERIYHIASAPHYPLPFPPREQQLVARDVYRGSPLESSSVQRALLLHMLAWVEKGEEPPASKIPRVANGSLVEPEELRYPLRWLETPRTPHRAMRFDFGPRFATEAIIDSEPPKTGPGYAVRVPQIDWLGNEATGIRTLDLRVPIGTWLPWALRTGMPGPTDVMADYFGSFVPLARTPQERREGDERPALSERHASRMGYLAEVDDALDALEAEGWLLARDRARERAAAVARWEWATARGASSASPTPR